MSPQRRSAGIHRIPSEAVAHLSARYSSADLRSRRADGTRQHCYSLPWRIALLERFWQARHPPRYAAYLTPSSPRFPLSSTRAQEWLKLAYAKNEIEFEQHLAELNQGQMTGAPVQRQPMQQQPVQQQRSKIEPDDT